MALNEHFKKVMDECLLPEDFGLEEFSKNFVQNIGIGKGTGNEIQASQLWASITKAFHSFIEKYPRGRLEMKHKRLAKHILRELWSDNEEELNKFLIEEVAKKRTWKAGKKGIWQKKMKLLVSKQLIFKHVGERYLNHKSKLQMGKKWLFTFMFRKFAQISIIWH